MMAFAAIAMSTKSYSMGMLLILMFFWSKFLLSKSSLIMNLLILEMTMMVNLFFFINATAQTSGNLFLCFITISVCEAVLGLAMLIFLSRYKSPEMIQLN